MRAGPPPRTQQLVSIVTLTVMLVWIIVARTHCSDGIAALFRSIEETPKRSASDAGQP